MGAQLPDGIPVQFPSMNTQIPNLVQFQLVHPLQQYKNYTVQQELTPDNPLCTVIPSVGNYVPIFLVPQNSLTFMVPIAMSTSPSTNYINSPGCVNSKYIANSDVLPNTPFTSMSSFTQSSDMAPLLDPNRGNFNNCNDSNQISYSKSPVVRHSIDGLSKFELDDVNHAAVRVCPRAMTTSSVHPNGEEIEASNNKFEELWSGNCNYSEYIENGVSNLFISWSGTASELLAKLCHHDLLVRKVCRTNDVGIFNVIFGAHNNARKAFFMQREIKLRMVPPKNSSRNWLRNPSPKFLVKFETRCRLVVKKGKAECQEIVGDLLMTHYHKQKGCIIWADQLKGHRIRVVSCEGNFKLVSGRIIEMKGVRTYSDAKAPLGWIYYRNKLTKKMLVTRRSGNKLEEYIYKE